MKRAKVKIEHFKQLNGSPAAKISLRAAAVLPDTGHYRDVLFVQWDHQAITAMEGDEAVGVLTFSKSDWQNCIMVILAYVEPGYRRQGIYFRMWKRLVSYAEKEKIPWIIGATHPNNMPTMKAMRRFGRKPFRILFEFKVK